MPSAQPIAHTKACTTTTMKIAFVSFVQTFVAFVVNE